MAALLDKLMTAGRSQKLLGRGVPPDYPGRLREALHPDGNLPSRPVRVAAPVVPGLAEPLSDRESEVLTLLAAGTSNRQLDSVVAVAEQQVRDAAGGNR
jgi:DNA-binding NarL/FixJ family response regulator